MRKNNLKSFCNLSSQKSKQRFVLALCASFWLLPLSEQGKASSLQQYAGYDRLELAVPFYDRPLQADIWYPAATKTYKGITAQNAIFKGKKAYIGAAIEKKKHPLVIISHGSGGAKESMAWLASGLAKKGAMVLVFNHPGSTSGDSSPRRSIRHWTRAKDISEALDVLFKDRNFGPWIEETKIAAVGFSLGGATVLSLAGAKMDLTRYQHYCATYQTIAEDCIFFQKGGVDYAAIDSKAFAQDLKDTRIKQTIALDPGLTYGMTPKSLQSIDHPVLVISLGDGKTQLLAAKVTKEGSGLIEHLENRQHVSLAPASHFTALPLCKPEGAALLKEEEDDPICDDPIGTDRADIHHQIIERSAKFLKLPGS